MSCLLPAQGMHYNHATHTSQSVSHRTVTHDRVAFDWVGCIFLLVKLNHIISSGHNSFLCRTALNQLLLELATMLEPQKAQVLVSTATPRPAEPR